MPELNSAGTPTGANISGATTVQLTAAQVQAATQRKLWIMGGVVGAPLNGRTDLAFGVLRCAIDNANADNVEWIGFPAGAVHVFCYAYYVSAAPSSATITIVKNVTGGSPASQSFNFGGNTSFNPGGAFSLKKGEQISFVRAVGQSWTVSESSLPAGYNFTDITCSGSPPQAVIDNPTRTVTITPTAAGQQFTCTFNNAVIPPAVSLDIWKITTGGVGGPFNFNIGPSIGTQSATTVSEGTGVKALGVNTSSLSAGAYTVAEQVPTSSAAGSWAATGVECYDNSGASVSTTGSAANFGINLAANTACYVTNTFSPQGKITVQAMQTGPGSFNSTSAQSTYIVSDPNGGSKVQTATNSGFNSFATAEPQGGADHTTDLSFQSYQITGIAPEDTDTGAWAVDSVTCNAGNPQIDASNLFVTLTLSPSDPAVTCNFVYRFIPASGSLTQVPNKCATPTHSPKVSGTATVITCRAKTNVGNVKWSVRCTARASSGRGDLRYCRAKYLKNGKVKITTYGERITVKLTGKVAGSGQYAPWSKTYKWKR